MPGAVMIASDEEPRMTKVPQQQIPGVYHHRVGDIVVTALSDGFLDGSLDVLRNISQAEARQILTNNFRPARRTPVNAFLIYSAGRLALIETGSGNYLLPTAGKVLENLKAAGVAPTDIEAVLLTHMHPDHSAGLTDMETNERNFPNAELVVHENEPRHWFDDAKMATATERAKKLYFQCAREQTTPYKERTRLFTAGEVFPGVTAIPRHGHTPGHTTFLISSGNDQLLIWGDTVHVPEVQTARPEVCMEFDTDAEAAAASRRKVFDMVATDRLRVTGMHLHFPGFAHLVRRGTGYHLIPTAWEQEM
jgi:glyoxylase-like metal-dependent hydrolase (beta-lactamase superfamily II)